MCERASAIVLVIAFCLVQGSAFADPLLAEKMLGDGLLQYAVPIESSGPTSEPTVAPLVLPVTAPAVAAPLAAPEAVIEPGEHRDQRRILSYIILQSLQGAGPFAGAR